MTDQLSLDELQPLAAKIAVQIITDPALADTLAGGLAGLFGCPPRKLCCHVGYGCESPFRCRPEFGCPQSFVVWPP